MPAVSILIKPSSANCNMDCEYCFYKCLSRNREEFSKGFMSEDTLELLIAHVLDYAEDYACFAFQGGEPTLAGIEFFQKVVELQERYNTKHLTIENTIQTNGIFLDDQWAQFLYEQDFLVGISLDGPRKLHDSYRRDEVGKPTFERVMHTIKLLEQYHVKYNILSVITGESVTKAPYLYHFYKRNGFRYVQLIPCIDERARGKESNAERARDKMSVSQGDGWSEKAKCQSARFTLKAEQYGRFLCEMFDLWYEDFCREEAMNGVSMDIRMFSNLAQMAAGFPAEECGMNGHCSCYFVVEGDGSVYPCDFYCMDSWRLGTVEDSFETLAKSDRVEKFVQASLPIHEKCCKCPYFSLCRGGCRRWRENADNTMPGLNLLCPAYECFFSYAGPRIQKLGQRISIDISYPFPLK